VPSSLLRRQRSHSNRHSAELLFGLHFYLSMNVNAGGGWTVTAAEPSEHQPNSNFSDWTARGVSSNTSGDLTVLSVHHPTSLTYISYGRWRLLNLISLPPVPILLLLT
jgi:hypothetical protein